MTGGRNRALDLVCIGRTCVDLYAEQEGARLEDVQSFRKYVGGSAANIAVNTARLGVKTAMLARVGEEQMGRFVRKTMADTGVDVSHVTFDPEHLTPYVLLAVRDVEDYPGSSPTAPPPTWRWTKTTWNQRSSHLPGRCW